MNDATDLRGGKGREGLRSAQARAKARGVTAGQTRGHTGDVLAVRFAPARPPPHPAVPRPPSETVGLKPAQFGAAPSGLQSCVRPGGGEMFHILAKTVQANIGHGDEARKFGWVRPGQPGYAV